MTFEEFTQLCFDAFEQLRGTDQELRLGQVFWHVAASLQDQSTMIACAAEDPYNNDALIGQFLAAQSVLWTADYVADRLRRIESLGSNLPSWWPVWKTMQAARAAQQGG